MPKAAAPPAKRCKQSCVSCRKAKVKCSGGVPCDRCMRINGGRDCVLWHRSAGRPRSAHFYTSQPSSTNPKKHKAALTGPSSAFQSASDQRWPRPGASDPIRPSMALKNEKPTPLTPPKSDSVGKVRSFWPSNDLPKIYTIVAPAKPTVSDNPANDSDLPRNSRQVAMVDDKVKVGGAVAALLSSSSLQTTIVRDAKPSIMEPPAKHHKAHPCSCIPSWHPTVDAEVSYDGLKSKTKSVDTVEEAVKTVSLDRELSEPDRMAIAAILL